MDTKTELEAQVTRPSRPRWLRHYNNHQKKYTSLIIIYSLAATVYIVRVQASPWLLYWNLLNAGYSMGRLADMFLNPIDPQMIDQIDENTAKLRRMTDQLSHYTQTISTHYDNVNRMMEESRTENEHRLEDEL